MIGDKAAPNFISIRSDLDIIAARMAARDFARRLSFSTIDQARIATATSELARMVLSNAGEGSISLWEIQLDNRCGLELVFEDQRTNPQGSSSITSEWSNPYDTVVSGLTAVRRLMDEMEIKANNGSNPTITCRKWRNR